MLILLRNPPGLGQGRASSVLWACCSRRIAGSLCTSESAPETGWSQAPSRPCQQSIPTENYIRGNPETAKFPFSNSEEHSQVILKDLRQSEGCRAPHPHPQLVHWGTQESWHSAGAMWLLLSLLGNMIIWVDNSEQLARSREKSVPNQFTCWILCISGSLGNCEKFLFLLGCMKMNCLFK